MKIIFMGSPDFATPTLQKLIDSEHEIVAAYAQPPRPAGRGQKERKTAVHILAEAHDIPVFTPKRLKGDALEILRATPCDAIVVVAYGLLLPRTVLDHAPCLNLHPSALPRWRGAAPLQHTLLAGDTTTEVCIMALDEGMDTGAVYARTPLTVSENMTFGDLHDTTAKIGADMMLEVLDTLHERTPMPQNKKNVTLAPKITPAMRAIEWAHPATEIHNQIRAFSPFPTAFTRFGSENWKILGSLVCEMPKTPDLRPPEEENFICGTIIVEKNTLTVICGAKNGQPTALSLTRLQRPSKKALPVADFLAGFSFEEGAKFE